MNRRCDLKLNQSICVFKENESISFYIMPNLFNFVKHTIYQSDMKRSKIINHTIAIALIVMFAQCTPKDKQLNKQLNKMADNLNESTPTVLDPHTRFDSVGVTTDNVFQYYYTLINIDNPEKLLKEQKDEIINNMGSAFTTDKSLQIFTKNNVTLQYIYRDTAHTVIDIITIEPDNYR